MHGRASVSKKSRIIIVVFHTIIVIIVIWIYFGGGIEAIGNLLNLNLSRGNLIRLIILTTFSVVYYIRMLFTMFVFLNRNIEWKETIAVTLALAFYHIGFAITGAFIQISIDLFDLIALVLFAIGSYLNSFSEYQRMKFKEKEENKGKLYTKGLFKYSQHINYFGDFVWILGFALMTRNPWALILPLFCFVNFVFFNIPMLDKYLADKYGEDFRDWRQKTKKFIPFIY